MSFKSREKKRRAKLAVARSKDRNKMAGRHYLTIVSRHCCCNNCGGSLREGRECVYRRMPKEILCTRCADVRRFWCSRHTDQAEPGDDERYVPTFRVDPATGMPVAFDDEAQQHYERVYAKEAERSRREREGREGAAAERGKVVKERQPAGPGWDSWT